MQNQRDTKICPPIWVQELRHCGLCPRQCGADRTGGALGYCRAPALPKVFRWGPHFGEEPPISGTRGSGAVFFSHCPMGCLYCQNHPWTAGGQGEETSVEGLANIFECLVRKKCHNINLVTPEPWLPFIRLARESACAEVRAVPFVFNTSSYISLEAAREYRDLQDVVLADLRYATESCAAEGSRARDYPDAARAYVRWCFENIGPLESDDSGIATRGLVVRILVLPGHAAEAVKSLRWLYNACGRGVHVSMMSQYTPAYKALEASPWNRTITEDEFMALTDEADRLGMEMGWTQEWGTAVGDDELMGQNMPPGEGSVGETQ